jgi:hypothetical protein
VIDATTRAVAQLHESAGNLMPQEFEHFERRLVEESSKLRLEMAELRTDVRGELGAIRTEIATALGAMRVDMATELGGMRADLTGVRAEIAVNKFELLKWAFVFWVGQVVGVAGIVGLLLRVMPAR